MTIDEPTAHLDVHVLNGGYGESIVVRLPDDRWGVVDCYASSVQDSSTNPTIAFLKARGIATLEFLCLTHPHADHFRGMSQLFEEFSIKYFWRFAGITREGLTNLVTYLKGAAQEDIDPHAQHSVNDFEKTLQLVIERRRAGSLQVKHLSDIKALYPVPLPPSDDERLEIKSIAPSSDQVKEYEATLSACFTADGVLTEDKPALRHNGVSVALLIRYGSTRVVLGGDVERSGWTDTLSQLKHEELAAHAVKASHHGSTNGYTPDLWAIFTSGTEPVAIITPSRRHGLPSPEAVTHIASYAGHVVTTCLPAISFVAGPACDLWEDYPLEVQLALRSCFSQLRADRMEGVGRCSFSFDDRGNCVSEDLIQPAGKLPEPNSGHLGRI